MAVNIKKLLIRRRYKAFDGSFFEVALDNTDLAAPTYGGCVAVIIEKDIHIMDVHVNVELRGQKFCQRLLKRALHFGTSKHCVKAILHTNNPAMIGCAEAVGFVSGDDETHMEKNLKLLVE